MPLSPIQGVIVGGVGVSSVFAQTNFSGTITLGSIILGIMVLVVAGLFTIRSNVAKVWREEAEGQKERCDRLLDQLNEEREVRHALKGDLAATTQLLAAERAKPDLSVVATAQAQMLDVLTQLAAASAAGKKTDEKLEEIHLLVNSRLDEALNEIRILKERLGLPPDAGPNDPSPTPGGS